MNYNSDFSLIGVTFQHIIEWLQVRPGKAEITGGEEVLNYGHQYFYYPLHVPEEDLLAVPL